jgi:hypothetical protein
MRRLDLFVALGTLLGGCAQLGGPPNPTMVLAPAVQQCAMRVAEESGFLVEGDSTTRAGFLARSATTGPMREREVIRVRARRDTTGMAPSVTATRERRSGQTWMIVSTPGDRGRRAADAIERECTPQ